jgi:hypothetical protein
MPQCAYFIMVALRDCGNLAGGRRQIDKWDACEASDGSIDAFGSQQDDGES